MTFEPSIESWGVLPRSRDDTWKEVLRLEDIELDQDEDTTLHVFPGAPELSHVTLKVRGTADGEWLACFDAKIVESAWCRGMPTALHSPDHEFVYDRTLGARELLLTGDCVDGQYSIVHYPKQEVKK